MTRQEVVARFAATPGAPRRAGAAAMPTTGLTPAAVLVPLVERSQELTVLLTLRTDHLRDHAGQISFPGGHIESGDGSPEEAALRETEEEIGLTRAQIDIIGRLDDYDTRTGFAVTPVVGMVSPPLGLRLDASEVAETFEVPLSFVLDPANHERHRKKLGGRMRTFHVILYESRYIWGATAGILVSLYEVLRS